MSLRTGHVLTKFSALDRSQFTDQGKKLEGRSRLGGI